MNTIETFWRPIFETNRTYNKDADWIKNYESSINIEQQTFNDISTNEIRSSIENFANWKSPGIDNIQNFWWKHFTSTHESFAKLTNAMILEPKTMPEWLTTGKTTLVPKSSPADDPNNFRPITCLPIMYKVISSVINNRLLSHLTTNKLIPEEQKGCAPNTYGCIDQLFIDSMILDDAKSRQKNLSIAWIDYRKAYDSIPHEWLIKSLEMHKFDQSIINFVKYSMLFWKTTLNINSTNETHTTSQININTGIFQGDSTSGLYFITSLLPLSWLLKQSKLGYRVKSKNKDNLISHLMFVDDLKIYASNDNQLKSLISTTKIFSDDIGMSFGLKKCNKITILRGKITKTENIQLSNDEIIKELENNETYKYLGINENNEICKTYMKSKLKNEYFTRVKKIIKSELNSKNTITAINTYAVPAISYGFAILDWSETELDIIDRETRNLLKRHHMIHNNSNVIRIYLQRKEGGRGLLNLKQQYKKTIIKFKIYLNQTRSTLLKLASEWDNKRESKSLQKKAENYCKEKNINLPEIQNNEKPSIRRIINKSFQTINKTKLKEMKMHGQYFKLLEEPHINKKLSILWLSNSHLKRKTESDLCAIQDQAITTKYIEKHIYKSTTNSTCRLCKTYDETIHHITSGCPTIAPTLYLNRHNNLAKYIYIKIANQHNLNTTNKWYNYEPPRVLENEKIKLLWDFSIQTDKTVNANKPDIIIINKQQTRDNNNRYSSAKR